MTGRTALAAMGAALMILGVGAQDLSTAAAAERHGQDAAPPRQRQAQSRLAASQPRQAARGQQAQRGRASYYGPEFNGRRMANGARFDPRSNAAAHRTLPLGTTAQVTNLENGRTTEVRIEDRGPYARGRVIDVTPRTAEQLGMKQQGVAPVEVRPIEVPDHDERVAQR